MLSRRICGKFWMGECTILAILLTALLFVASGCISQHSLPHSGKNVGKRTTYYENGQKHFECEFKEGKAHGLEYLWDEQGNLIRLGSQSYGKGHGAYSWWDKDGKLRFVRINCDGQIIREIHYKKHNVVADGQYKDKKPWNGTFRDWHWKNGNEAFYHEIRNGQPWRGWFWVPTSENTDFRHTEDGAGWNRIRYVNGDPLAGAFQE